MLKIVFIFVLLISACTLNTQKIQDLTERAAEIYYLGDEQDEYFLIEDLSQYSQYQLIGLDKSVQKTYLINLKELVERFNLNSLKKNELHLKDLEIKWNLMNDLFCSQYLVVIEAEFEYQSKSWKRETLRHHGECFNLMSEIKYESQLVKDIYKAIVTFSETLKQKKGNN